MGGGIQPRVGIGLPGGFDKPPFPLYARAFPKAKGCLWPNRAFRLSSPSCLSQPSHETFMASGHSLPNIHLRPRRIHTRSESRWLARHRIMASLASTCPTSIEGDLPLTTLGSLLRCTTRHQRVMNGIYAPSWASRGVKRRLGHIGSELTLHVNAQPLTPAPSSRLMIFKK